MFKIVHDVIPVNFYMYKRHIYKTDKCTFCKHFHVETIQHLFYDCVHVKPLKTILNTWFVSLTQGSQFTLDHIRFRDLPALHGKSLQIALFLISDFVYVIWCYRNLVKFDHVPFSGQSLIMRFLGRIRVRILADFHRMSLLEFVETWCTCNNMFCRVVGDRVIISFMG